MAADLVQQLIGTKIYDPKVKTPEVTLKAGISSRRYRELEYRYCCPFAEDDQDWASVFQDVFTARAFRYMWTAIPAILKPRK